MPVVTHSPLIEPYLLPAGQNERPIYPTQWSDPHHSPMTSQGDEFAYTSFNQMRRKWAMHGTTASDFDFHGSSVGWKIPGQHTGFYIPAPAGNIEVVMEFGPGNGPSTGSAGIQLGIIDAAGTGGLGSMNAAVDQTWTATTWALTGNVSASSAAITYNGGHKWQSIKRSGTTLTFRTSDNGSTWNAFGGGVTVGTSGYIVIGSLHNSDNPAYVLLYRFNIYGPGFFPG